MSKPGPLSWSSTDVLSPQRSENESYGRTRTQVPVLKPVRGQSWIFSSMPHFMEATTKGSDRATCRQWRSPARSPQLELSVHCGSPSFPTATPQVLALLGSGATWSRDRPCSALVLWGLRGTAPPRRAP